MTSLTLKTLAETLEFGRFLGASLKNTDVVALIGPLGVGKTTLVQGIASGLKIDTGFQVTSPTFVYMQIYPGSIPLYHIDLYRIESERQLTTSGLMDSVGQEGASVIEWYDRYPNIWENPFATLTLSFGVEGQRRIDVHTEESRARKMLVDWETRS